VILPGGPGRNQADNDFSHLGFALDSRAEVDAIARRAREAGILAWEPRQEPFPVGYYCGLVDPDGSFVEFSYGQPLGPGAASLTDF
jgi:predicted lactoylglutathione lyase